MNGILGFSELLKNPELTGEEHQEYISIIESSGQRMLSIINDIIDISKIEAGLMQLYMGQTKISGIMEYIYSFFKPELEAKNIAFFYNNPISDSDSVIYTDNEKVHAVLMNLVKNAIKFTSEGKIEFGCKKLENLLQFYVKDTGIGIPKIRQEAIFVRFIQADIED